MKKKSYIGRINWVGISSLIPPLLLFWAFLIIRVPPSFSKYFHTLLPWYFPALLILYLLSFRLPGRIGTSVCLGLTMALLAFSLSYHWTSGFSDNGTIGGLVPYKDGKYYYMGADLILNGYPPINANQATERPLFPSFLASMLLFTGQNLKITLAICVQLIGIGIYLSTRQVRGSYGGWGGSLYATFLYFYIQPLIGYTMSETLGFTLGCLGFSVIYFAAKRQSWQSLLLGIFLLIVGVSARAGTFFIFPMLALWVGWIFRGERQYSWKAMVYALGTVIVGYFLVNSVYSRLLGIPAGSLFGNFSYALYGQVRGGMGWHSAIEELGTRDPSIVYRAALEFFLDHPISLFIGFAKAYRDFFLLGGSGIFQFGIFEMKNPVGIMLWLGSIFLLIWGLIQLIRDIRSELSSLLVAGFIGIFLSIPFLPPIDGGARFYASTTPFFFVIPAAGVSLLFGKMQKDVVLGYDWMSDLKASQILSVFVIVMTLLMPLGLFFAMPSPKIPSQAALQCPSEQVPFVIDMHAGAYIDLIKTGSGQCGNVPNVCFDDFTENNTEKTTDDFYQELFRLTEDGKTNARIVPAINWLENEFHYFYLPHDGFSCASSYCMLSGCAIEIRTKYQSIYRVESVVSDLK